jgi:hypothetical protein
MLSAYRTMFRSILPLIEILGLQWFETATCERGFSIRTHTKTGQRYSMGTSLLAALMMIDINGPDIDSEEEVQKLVLAAVGRWKGFTERIPSRSSAGVERRRKSQSSSNAFAVLSGLEDVVLNDFLDDESFNSSMGLESEGSSSLPDPIPIETDAQRVAREERERAELDAVGGYKCDPGVTVEEVPEEVTFQILKKRFIAHRFQTGWEVGGVRLVEKRGANQGSFCIKYKTDKNLWLHELRKEDYGADKVWVLLNIPGKEKS